MSHNICLNFLKYNNELKLLHRNLCILLIVIFLNQFLKKLLQKRKIIKLMYRTETSNQNKTPQNNQIKIILLLQHCLPLLLHSLGKNF